MLKFDPRSFSHPGITVKIIKNDAIIGGNTHFGGSEWLSNTYSHPWHHGIITERVRNAVLK